MSTSFLEAVRPVQFNLGRVIVAFSPAFLVPMAWAWAEDHERLLTIWAACFVFTLLTGATPGNDMNLSLQRVEKGQECAAQFVQAN